jgi:hypothetical protein
MGLFDWLFGKKKESGGVSTTAPREPWASNPSAPADSPSQRPNSIPTLLQQVKELAPNDPRRAASLLREMLQAAVTLPANSEFASELNMALDSMARHYPDALAGLANTHPDSAVRGKASSLRSQRQEQRGMSNGTIDNVQRWKQSTAMVWVAERQGQWDHAQWLQLLEQLRHSEFWPMDEEQIGQALEEIKQQWLQQRRSH